MICYSLLVYTLHMIDKNWYNHVLQSSIHHSCHQKCKIYMKISKAMFINLYVWKSCSYSSTKISWHFTILDNLENQNCTANLLWTILTHWIWMLHYCHVAQNMGITLRSVMAKYLSSVMLGQAGCWWENRDATWWVHVLLCACVTRNH